MLPFAATWMDPDNICLSKISQRQALYALTYVWNKYIWATQGYGIKSYKPLPMKQINNKDMHTAQGITVTLS